MPNPMDRCICGHVANAHLTSRSNAPDKWEYCALCSCKKYQTQK